MNTSLLSKYSSYYQVESNNVESIAAKEQLVKKIEGLKNDAHHQYIYNLIKEYYDKNNVNTKRLLMKAVQIPYKGKVEKQTEPKKDNVNIVFDINKFPIELQNLLYFLVIDLEKNEDNDFNLKTQSVKKGLVH